MSRLIISDTFWRILAANFVIFSFFLIIASPILAEEASSFTQLNYNLKQREDSINYQQDRQDKEAKQPIDRKEGWSEWQRWNDFPHEQIQLGVSNTDYGGLMDMEYKCFGKVGRDNDIKKSQTYWYRIADRTEFSEYVKIEIGCFIDGQFKASLLINGLIQKTNSSFKSQSKVYAQLIKVCPREFTGWNFLQSFETKNYTLALCQQDDFLYLVGHQKYEHERFISARVTETTQETIIAQSESGLTFKINQNELNVIQNNQVILREKILASIEKKQNNLPNLKLTGVVWNLYQIRYNNNQVITVNEPANYTIEFLADGSVKIKADCNRATGTYTEEGNSISIVIGPTTTAMCPPESISDQYLREIQSAAIFFFQDGNLYIDLVADTGTMMFKADNLDIDQTEDKNAELDFNSNEQDTVNFGGPSSVGNELREDKLTRDKRSLLPGVDSAFQPWFNWKQQVNQDVGLNFGLDYNTVYQKLTNSLNFDEAGGGIFRFFGDWTLLGRNTDHPGSVVFKVENRHDFSRVAPQNLGFQAGYSGITSTQYSNFGWGVTNLFWKQKFNNGRISFLIGKVDPTDYVDIYALTNPQTHFQNLAFLTDPTIAAPNQGLGVALGVMLSDNVYLVTGFSDANGEPTEAGFDTFFNDGEYFKHLEIGWTSSPDRIYLENIHLTAWHSDARNKANTPETWGLAFSAAWFVDDLWMPFLRGGYSNGGASLMKGSVSAGLGRYFPESGNLLGFGFNWGQPADTSLDSQVTTEVFYRIQVTQNWAITPNIQVLVNPALNPDKSALALFGIRSRLNF